MTLSGKPAMRSNRHRYSVLFLSESVYSLHLIAESQAKKMGVEHVVFHSASLTPRPIHPFVAEWLKQNQTKPTDHPEHSFDPRHCDLIITIGRRRPSIPNQLACFHWETPDGSDSDPTDTAAPSGIVTAMDIIEKNIENLFNTDFLNTLFIARRHQQLILDNMLDGVMAHNEKRIIFFFNKAAERITGRNREAVLGRDCHSVFSGRFCGGSCDYCEGPLHTKRSDTHTRRRVDFKTADGQQKVLEMLTLPLADETGYSLGALVLFKDETDLEQLKRRLKHHHSLGRLVTKDPKMLAVFDQIREVASIQAPVLVEGESGTGKELVANAIHDMSPRADKPFVAINCGALPEGILESELFGHVKGAFTGAISDKKGRFELADQGTLFLDEVAELSPAMQVKLLRALQEKRFEPVGGEKSIRVNIRVISATNQDLKVLMKKKRFRRDLFYRLCVVPISLPPLRERRLDIPLLVEHFLELVAAETERPVLGYTNEAIDTLSAYTWPGNVRELRNTIEYAYVKSRDRVMRTEHLPPEIVSFQRKGRHKTGPPLKIKKNKVVIALAEANGNRKEAARALGIGRATLYRYLDCYGLK
jgi:sigma-54 dependent transcriptional regulator, acetoin dehydrogenase operon transcriptional activator AcoR